MQRFRSLGAVVLGLAFFLSACSGNSGVPESLAFDDALAVNRPVGNPCASNEISVVFDEGVVLSDSDAVAVGPFEVELPAGTYDVLLSSWLGAHEDPSQTSEQWFFTTDSGYVSPATLDSSPELLMNQAFRAQSIGESTSVTLHHIADGETDSVSTVHPLCVGFREIEAEEMINATDSTDAGVQIPAVQVSFTPDAGNAADTHVNGFVPPAQTGDAQTGTAQTGDEANADAADVPELALTGPSDLVVSLTLTGAALILAGSAATVATRRSQDF